MLLSYFKNYCEKYLAGLLGSIIWFLIDRYIRQKFQLGGTETAGLEYTMLLTMGFISGTLAFLLELIVTGRISNNFVSICIVTLFNLLLWDITNEMFDTSPQGLLGTALSIYLPLIIMLSLYYWIRKCNR